MYFLGAKCVPNLTRSTLNTFRKHKGYSEKHGRKQCKVQARVHSTYDGSFNFLHLSLKGLPLHFTGIELARDTCWSQGNCEVFHRLQLFCKLNTAALVNLQNNILTDCKVLVEPIMT